MSLSRPTAILARDMNIVSVLTTAYIYQKRTLRSGRRFGVNPVNSNRLRQGYYTNLVAEMRLVDETFTNFHRMTPAVFDELLSIVGPSIQRLPVGERSITAGQRLSLTLRYLSSGDSMISIGRYGYRIGKSTTLQIIREVCAKLWYVLKEEVFPNPSCIMWKNIARDFDIKWNFPNCLGAIDGKHVVIQAFGNSGSNYYNYKHSHSLVLFAVVDANYKFIMVEVGAPGHVGDSTIFRNSSFGKAVLSGGAAVNIPSPAILQDNQKHPFVFVGDEAFPLLPNLMRPYPGRNASVLPEDQTIFYYRLSRARRVVENAYGILPSRWHIYRRPIIATKPTVLTIIKATVVLHNWLREKRLEEYMSADLVDSYVGGTHRPGRWREEGGNGMTIIQRLGCNNPNQSAVNIRDQYKVYFNEVDILPWQNNSIF